MSNTELVAVSKGSEYLEVHPSTLIAHIALGWRACEPRAAGACQGDASMTMPELLAARDTMLRREGELNEQAERLGEQARANEAEAERLQLLAAIHDDEGARLTAAAAQLAADRAAFEASKTVVPDLSTLTKEQLQTALDEKGIKYPAAANKAELQALLAAA